MIIKLEQGADKPLKNGLGFDLIAKSVVRKSQDVFLFDTGVRAKPIAGYYIEVAPHVDLLESHFIGTLPVTRLVDPENFTLIKVALRYIGHLDFLVDVDNGDSASLMEARANALIGTKIGHIMNMVHTNIPMIFSESS